MAIDYRARARSDRELIEGVVGGVPGTSQEFVRRYGGFIRRALLRKGLPAEAVSDLYQEVFLHLWERNYERLRQWRGLGSGKFVSFLAAVTTRLVYDYWRAQRRKAELEGLADVSLLLGRAGEAGDVDAYIERRMQLETINCALTALSQKDADILLRRYSGGQSYRDMANDLQISVNHVGVNLSRAERRLQRLVAGNLDGSGRPAKSSSRERQKAQAGI